MRHQLSILILLFCCSSPTLAASAAEINIKTDAALALLKQEVVGADAFLQDAAGVLVFPEVLKAGIGIGGEYGEGALRINNQTKAYYKTLSASIGFQLGAQKKTVILVFLTQEALQGFQQSEGWEAGVDGSVTLVEIGAGKDINSMNFPEPILGFIISNKGLMFNLTLEGTKIEKFNPS